MITRFLSRFFRGQSFQLGDREFALVLHVSLGPLQDQVTCAQAKFYRMTDAKSNKNQYFK